VREAQEKDMRCRQAVSLKQESNHHPLHFAVEYGILRHNGAMVTFEATMLKTGQNYARDS